MAYSREVNGYLLVDLQYTVANQIGLDIGVLYYAMSKSVGFLHQIISMSKLLPTKSLCWSSRLCYFGLFTYAIITLETFLETSEVYLVGSTLEKLLGPTKSLCWSLGLYYMDWFICYYHTWNMLGTSQIYLLGCTLGKLFSCGKCLSSSWNSLLGILLFCIVFLFLRDHPQNKSNHIWGRMGLGWYAGKPNSHSFANEVSVATALIFWFIVNCLN